MIMRVFCVFQMAAMVVAIPATMRGGAVQQGFADSVGVMQQKVCDRQIKEIPHVVVLDDKEKKETLQVHHQSEGLIQRSSSIDNNSTGDDSSTGDDKSGDDKSTGNKSGADGKNGAGEEPKPDQDGKQGAGEKPKPDEDEPKKKEEPAGSPKWKWMLGFVILALVSGVGYYMYSQSTAGGPAS